METGPGEEAQVDFGTGAWVCRDDKRRRPWLFRVVLSYSRKAYSEVVWRQTTDNFIACLENAFQHFGGVPQRLVIDNLKAAVSRSDWYDPEVHPKLQSFAQHYGTVFIPTRPYTPRHKGKVEGGVKYAQNNCLKGRSFDSLDAQNQFLWNWEVQVADNRIHGTTKQQVAARFGVEGQSSLKTLPGDCFSNFHESRRSVHRDGYVEVDKAYYSAPPEYVGRRLWVRWDSRMVRIFNDRLEQLALHAKTEPGRFRTAANHIPREKVSAVELGADAMLRQLALLGPQTKQWAEATLQIRGVAGRANAGWPQGPGPSALCRVLGIGLPGRLGARRHITCVRFASSSSGVPPAQQQFEFIEHHPDHSALERLFARLRFINFERNVNMNAALHDSLKRLRLSGLADSLAVRMEEAQAVG